MSFTVSGFKLSDKMVAQLAKAAGVPTARARAYYALVEFVTAEKAAEPRHMPLRNALETMLSGTAFKKPTGIVIPGQEMRAEEQARRWAAAVTIMRTGARDAELLARLCTAANEYFVGAAAFPCWPKSA